MRGVIISNLSRAAEVLKGISIGRQSGLEDADNIISQLLGQLHQSTSGLADANNAIAQLTNQLQQARDDYEARLADMKAEFDRDVITLRADLIAACRELDYLRSLDAFHRSERNEHDVLH
jgi:hypothetical protein